MTPRTMISPVTPCPWCGAHHGDDTCAADIERSALKDELIRIEAYYRAYASQLRRYVRRIATDCGLSESLVDAEGVVHEAFLSMAGSCDSIENPRAWLFTVTRRLVSKIAARHQHRRADEDPHELLHTGTVRWSSMAPRASAEDIVEARRVLEAIGELPDQQKAAVYLRHVEGWTTTEISKYLRCAPATVSVHVHRGISRLRLRVVSVIALIVTAGAGVAIAYTSATMQSMTPGSQLPLGETPDAPAPQSLDLLRWAHFALVVGIGALMVLAFFVGVLCVLAIADVAWRAVRKRRRINGLPVASEGSATSSPCGADPTSVLT